MRDGAHRPARRRRERRRERCRASAGRSGRWWSLLPPHVDVEDVHASEARRRTAVADRIRLTRLTLPVPERAVEAPVFFAADHVAGAPELDGVRLVGDVAERPDDLA